MTALIFNSNITLIIKKDLAVGLMKRITCGILLCTCIVLSSCLYTMEKQDIDFVNAIKSHLRKKGDFVKVSDIHPGNWTKVCFIGSYGDSFGVNIFKLLAEEAKVDSSSIKIKNRILANAITPEDFWVIAFLYQGNNIEVFYIKWQDSQAEFASLGNHEVEVIKCEGRNGHFVATGSRVEPNGMIYYADVPDDFIKIKITSEFYSLIKKK